MHAGKEVPTGYGGNYLSILEEISMTECPSEVPVHQHMQVGEQTGRLRRLSAGAGFTGLYRSHWNHVDVVRQLT